MSQRAMLANVAALHSLLYVGQDEIGFSWCPLYHDMGLVTSVVMPLALEWFSMVLQPTDEFVRNPLKWLRLLDETNASITQAPNFAIALATRALRQREPDMDLSRVRALVTGAEPVVPKTVNEFLTAFEPAGLSASAIWPAWGLAENTLIGAACRGGLRLNRVDRQSLQQERRAVLVGDDNAEAVVHPCLGPPTANTTIRVVDDDNTVLSEGYVGNIEIKSPSLMDGYLGMSREDSGLLSDGYLKTGDVGYLDNRELYLVGRAKDLIIVAGRNVAPQEIEHAVESIEGARPGGVAAIGRPGPEGTEELVVIIEWRGDSQGLEQAVSQECVKACSIGPAVVATVPPGSLPRTTSGKLQRNRARELFEVGELGDVLGADRNDEPI